MQGLGPSNGCLGLDSGVGAGGDDGVGGFRVSESGAFSAMQVRGTWPHDQEPAGGHNMLVAMCMLSHLLPNMHQQHGIPAWEA